MDSREASPDDKMAALAARSPQNIRLRPVPPPRKAPSSPKTPPEILDVDEPSKDRTVLERTNDSVSSQCLLPRSMMLLELVFTSF